MADVAPSRSAILEMRDERQAMVEGHAFLDEKCLAIAAEIVRELTRYLALEAAILRASREAARALAAAGDLLERADRVTVATVDAKPSEDGYGPHPGVDISTHLARHGVQPELINLDSTGRSETKAILDQALAVNADLIVMGGYGRSRMSEFIFGGVTREMLKTSNVPILMAH